MLTSLLLLIGGVLLLPYTTGMPAWGGAPGRASIGNLVPGAAHIEAIMPSRDSAKGVTTHLTIPVLDHLGNLTLLPTEETSNPPMFFINRDHLWLFRNESAIYPVSLVNATGNSLFNDESTQLPLQLVVDQKHIGVGGGYWKWRGTRLHYYHGNRHNAGVYYTCPTDDGGMGVFLAIKFASRMLGCKIVSLHSYNRVDENSQMS